MDEGFVDFYIRNTLAVGFGCAVACIGKRMFWTHTPEEDHNDFVKASGLACACSHCTPYDCR